LSGLDNRMRYGMEAQQWKDALAQRGEQNRYQMAALNANAGLQRADIAGQYGLQRTLAQMEGKATKDEKTLTSLGKSEYDKLAKEWDPGQQVRSAFGQAGQADLNAVRGLALKLRAGDKFDPNNVQMAEMAAALGRLVTGGVPTAHTMENFNPGSLSKIKASLEQWVTGKPVPVGMPEWAKQFELMLAGESEAAKNYVRKNRLENSERLRRYSQIDPESARRFVKAKGMDVEHPQGYIDPETFEVRNFNPNASPYEVAGVAPPGGAPAASGKVKVRRKSDGQVGTVTNPDPAIYDRVE
jgi:hypothetical protein